MLRVASLLPVVQLVSHPTLPVLVTDLVCHTPDLPQHVVILVNIIIIVMMTTAQYLNIDCLV